MSGYPILRLKSYCAQNTQLNPSNLEYHVYPFTTLTSVKSHIHPRFVIYNTGRVLRNRPSEIFELGRSLGEQSETAECISGILRIYEEWIKPPPSSFFESPPSNFSLSGDSSEDETKTKKLRLDKQHFARRFKRNRPLESPTPSGNRQPRSGNGQDAIWVDDKTLRGLDDDATPMQKLIQKQESVKKWLRGIDETYITPVDLITLIPSH